MTTKNNYHIFEESWKIGSPENGGGATLSSSSPQFSWD